MPTDHLDQEIVNALASCFDTREAAIAVLSDLGVDFGSLPPFASMTIQEWWRSACAQLAKGLVTEGVPRLLRAAAVRYPGNPHFEPYKGPEADPDHRGGDSVNVEMIFPADLPDHLVQQLVKAALDTARKTGKRVALQIGEKRSSRFEISVEGLPPDQVQGLIQDLRRLAEAQGVDAKVERQRHDFPDYYMDPLRVVGPDGRRFELSQIRASTQVKDVARGVMSEYADTSLRDKAKAGAWDHATVDHLTDSGSVRLDPMQSLHNAGVRPGGTLLVAPERTAGAVNPLVREEALARARLKVLAHASANPGFEVEANSLVAPTEYRFTFRTQGFAPPAHEGSGPREISLHKVLVELPPDFPIKAPVAWWQTDIFHPNIDPKTGWVCLGPLQEHYRPDLDFGDLCKMLVDMAGYRTYTLSEGFNPDAARWAASDVGQAAIGQLGGHLIGEQDAGEEKLPRRFRIQRVK